MNANYLLRLMRTLDLFGNHHVNEAAAGQITDSFDALISLQVLRLH